MAKPRDQNARPSADARRLFETSGEFLAAAGRSALSIRYSLPLVFTFLLLAVVLVYSWATYRELSHSASDAAIDRLRRTTEQLALSSEAGARRLRASLREAAADTALRDFLRNPSGPARGAALEQVKAVRTARMATQQRVRVELRGRDERILLADGPELPAVEAGDTPGIPLRDWTAPYVGDQARVQQILINLLSNAVKFTPSHGRVTVRCGTTATVPTEAVAPGAAAWTYFTVEDIGIGIPEDKLESIFHPFTQVESGYTRTHGGTGLGLAISRRLARLMGGDITVESREGQGSRFTLWLPAGPTGTGGSSEGRRDPGQVVHAGETPVAVRTGGAGRGAFGGASE